MYREIICALFNILNLFILSLLHIYFFFNILNLVTLINLFILSILHFKSFCTSLLYCICLNFWILFPETLEMYFYLLNKKNTLNSYYLNLEKRITYGSGLAVIVDIINQPSSGWHDIGWWVRPLVVIQNCNYSLVEVTYFYFKRWDCQCYPLT